jgi:Flp pilus assembly protein TadG
MRTRSQRKRRQRGTVLVLYTLLLPTLMIPLVGLATDLNILYIVQAKLSAAVDGAALGAGRLLGTGANIEEIAQEFLKVNFPNGYWGATNMTQQISYTRSLNTHTITVNATVETPLLFMRVLGLNSSVVAATGVATRKETRVMLVLDRSGSLNSNDSTGHNVFQSLRGAALQFTNMFTPGVDELGLAVFSGSGIVLYPPLPRPWDPNPTGAGGPDVNFLSNHVAGGLNQPAGDMEDHLNNIQALGGTSMAEGLTQGWVELQKAFNRDGEGINDLKLNSIVLFTDGVPSALTGYLNQSAGWALKTKCTGSGCNTSTTSPCTYNPATTAATRMIGRMVVASYPPSWGGVPPMALYALASMDNHSATYWDTRPDSDPQITGTPVNGCYGSSPSPGGLNSGNLADLKWLPPTDYYGNSTNGTAYTSSTKVYNGTAYNSSNISNPYHFGIAAWNATDNAGLRIRTDPNMKIAIYVIAYAGAGGTDSVLLKRIANVAPYNAGQEAGMYVEANDAAGLVEAFNTVASELLRLAK